MLKTFIYLYLIIDGDYETIVQEIIFSPGDQLKTVNVTIIDDEIFENLEEFSARLTTLDGRVVLAESNAVAQILDDDSGIITLHNQILLKYIIPYFQQRLIFP